MRKKTKDTTFLTTYQILYEHAPYKKYSEKQKNNNISKSLN